MADEDLVETIAACPRLTVRTSGSTLDLSVDHRADEELRAQLVRLLGHPAIASFRHLSLSARGPTMPESDFRWALDAVGSVRRFDRVFVGSARILTFEGPLAMCAPGARLSCASWRTEYRGAFPGIHTLDLRDMLVTWGECTWPDLEVLILRPRHGEHGMAQAREVLASATSFPRVCEVRFPENDGDDLVAALLESPVLAQLRRVDLTDNISDRGAELLREHADRVAHLDELWIGSTGDRRWQCERTSPSKVYPRGTLEISEAWGSRLRARFGRMLRFRKRPGHPDL